FYIRCETLGHRIRNQARQDLLPLFLQRCNRCNFFNAPRIFFLSVVLIDASSVSPFGESASQVRFINSLALRKRKEMTAFKEDSSRVAKSRQTKKQFTADNSSSASSCNRERN